MHFTLVLLACAVNLATAYHLAGTGEPCTYDGNCESRYCYEVTAKCVLLPRRTYEFGPCTRDLDC